MSYEVTVENTLNMDVQRAGHIWPKSTTSTKAVSNMSAVTTLKATKGFNVMKVTDSKGGEVKVRNVPPPKPPVEEKAKSLAPASESAPESAKEAAGGIEIGGGNKDKKG